MVRLIVALAICSSMLLANSFDKNCVGCHSKLSVSLQEIMKHYLLAYSGEKNIKMGIDHYMKHPARDISAMPPLYLDEYGIIKHKKFDERELQEAIDTFWQRYKVMGRLK